MRVQTIVVGLILAQTLTPSLARADAASVRADAAHAVSQNALVRYGQQVWNRRSPTQQKWLRRGATAGGLYAGFRVYRRLTERSRWHRAMGRSLAVAAAGGVVAAYGSVTQSVESLAGHGLTSPGSLMVGGGLVATAGVARAAYFKVRHWHASDHKSLRDRLVARREARLARAQGEPSSAPQRDPFIAKISYGMAKIGLGFTTVLGGTIAANTLLLDSVDSGKAIGASAFFGIALIVKGARDIKTAEI